ncbi:type IV secretory system conjugative DNA transfer family protein [Marinicella sp. W31]|uniref:type IV secretory system conjugative DNA transfer family protein n=1 Tax=Marinicella sp. W31 TaxID=3023713 RepID=UPI0037573FED
MDKKRLTILAITAFVFIPVIWYLIYTHLLKVPSEIRFDLDVIKTLISGAGEKEFKKEALISGFIMVAPLILIMFLKIHGYQSRILGDARMAHPGEIRKYGYYAEKGVIVGQTATGKLLFSYGPKTVGLGAKPRSGKGVSFCVPNLLNWPGSALIIDIKKELFEITSGWRSKFQDVFVLDPLNKTFETHRLNIFDTIDQQPEMRISEVQKIAKALLPDGKDKFWDAGARKIFVGVALYLLETGQHCSIPAVLKWVGGSESLQDKMIAVIEDPEISQKLSDRTITLLREYAEMEPSNKLVPGYLESFNSHLEPFMNPLVAAATDESDFKIDDLKENPKSIYLVARPEDINVLGPLFGLITDNIVFSMTKKNPEQGEQGRVLFMLDEFTSLGPLERLKKGAAFLGGYGVRLCIIFQNYAQLEATYSREGAKELSGLMHERIYFASSDIEEAERISRELGKKTVRTQSRSYNRHSHGRSTSQTARDLLSPDEIMRLEDKKQLLLSPGQRPIFCNKVFYYKDKRFMSRLLKEVNDIPKLDVEKYSAKQETELANIDYT